MEYYLLIDGQKAGPYTIEQLRSMWSLGRMTAEALFWKSGMKEWQELRSMVATLQPSTPPPTDTGSSPVVRTTGTATRQVPKSRAGRVWWVLGFGVLAVCLVALGVWIEKSTSPKTPPLKPQLPAVFVQNLDRFLTDASRLNSLSSQGTAYQSFGDQLATTVASYELLVTVWPAGYQSNAKHEFKSAVEGWELLYQLWGRQFKEFKAWRYDAKSEATLGTETVAVLESYAPGRIQYMPKDDQYPMTETNYHYLIKSNVRVLMGVASEHFKSARDLIHDTIK